jgi:hypothetical protein
MKFFLNSPVLPVCHPQPGKFHHPRTSRRFALGESDVPKPIAVLLELIVHAGFSG